MINRTDITPEQSFFAVFCIEALAFELETTGNKVYKLLTERSAILDDYIIPYYNALYTQGQDYVVRELRELMQEKGLIT